MSKIFWDAGWVGTQLAGLAPRSGHRAKPPIRAALVLKAAGLIAAINVVCSINPDFAVVHA